MGVCLLLEEVAMEERAADPLCPLDATGGGGRSYVAEWVDAALSSRCPGVRTLR